ncbi:MAG: hypothetical protein R2713_10845 [Ilumatobacteraceae bacterium]|nr:hypothetical protein [Acidimicrobiales bacterium]MCB9392854.1 hypothetical protein [Acidimicrobiaceae bacterium]
MSTRRTPITKDWQERWFTFMERLETPVVRTTARMAGRMADYVPERPARLASMPKVHDLVDDGLTFRRRLVDEQTEFVRSMVKAMEPMLVKMDTVHPAERHDAARPHAGRTTTAAPRTVTKPKARASASRTSRTTRRPTHPTTRPAGPTASTAPTEVASAERVA